MLQKSNLIFHTWVIPGRYLDNGDLPTQKPLRLRLKTKI